MPRPNHLSGMWRRRRWLTEKRRNATESPGEKSTVSDSASTPEDGEKRTDQSPGPKTPNTSGDSENGRTALAPRAPNPLRTAPRDATGFIEGDLPGLSTAQYKWILARSQVADDEAACALTETPEIVVWDWKQDPGFASVLELTLSNRREGFKVLGTYLLPKALRKIEQLIDSDDPRSNAKGITLLLRAQGMLVDKVSRVDRSALESLMDSLRQATPIQVVEGTAVTVVSANTTRDEDDD